MFKATKKVLAGILTVGFLASGALPVQAHPTGGWHGGDVRHVPMGPGPAHRPNGGNIGPGPAFQNGHRHGPPHGPYGPSSNGNGWGTAAAIGIGALIVGGLVAASNERDTVASPRINPKHYQWCEDHYRSYRISDNTYQPYNGPRMQCSSPYY